MTAENRDGTGLRGGWAKNTVDEYHRHILNLSRYYLLIWVSQVPSTKVALFPLASWKVFVLQSLVKTLPPCTCLPRSRVVLYLHWGGQHASLPAGLSPPPPHFGLPGD